MNQSELKAGLSDPRAYGGAARIVTTLETHISLLFFAGERVYKVKKSVDLGFLDFTTLERRKHFCEEEVRLNRRLSPEVYLGVVPIVKAEDGSLVMGGSGTPVEWAVEMQRLPANAMLDGLLRAGAVDNQMMRDLASLLAEFHRGAATGKAVDPFGSPEAVLALVSSSLANLAAFAGSGEADTKSGFCALTPERLAFLKATATQFLEKSRELFERRVREGRIRDGHGDLHAGNICYRPDGIAIYDCIEFSETFRCSDVACDIAFLAMDFDYRGFHAFASYFVREYQKRANDPELIELIKFYKQYRAVVRAFVACATATSSPEELELREEKRAEAGRYLDLACAYALPPCMVLMCGLPGSGKSTIARGVAAPLNALVHRSDVQRKSLSPTPASRPSPEGFSQGLYSPEKLQRTYEVLLQSTVFDLKRGQSVVVDATFSKRARREEFIEAANELGVSVYIVEAFASEEATRERMIRRQEDRLEASTADFSVYLKARERFEALLEIPASLRIRVDTECTTAAGAASLLIERRIQTE